MRSRRALSAILFAALLLPCAAPLLLLAGAARRAIEPPAPRQVVLRDGRILLGQPFDEGRDGSVRILRGDGAPGPAALIVPREAIREIRPAPGVWVVERDDGPVLFGRPLALSGPGWRTTATDSVAHGIRLLPGRLRDERERLVREVREAGDAALEGPLADAWGRWIARDDSSLLDLDGGAAAPMRIRISGITAAWRSDAYGPATALRRLGRFLLAPPGAWGGGGILPALESMVLLALMAGLFAGVFGLCSALWIHARGQGEAWILRGRALVSNLAGVPGVVWGVAGAGLLVHGLGPFLDRAGGTTLWSGGGLLWSGVTLGALASPIVIALALEELDRIPRRSREIAWACGATRLQIVHRVILPSAWKGLLAAVLSGMARAAGETAPLLLVGAVHAFGGLALGGEGILSRLTGGFLHPGVLALDSPWTGIDLEQGEPLVALMLLLLSVLCIGLDLVASRLRHRAPVDAEDGP